MIKGFSLAFVLVLGLFLLQVPTFLLAEVTSVQDSSVRRANVQVDHDALRNNSRNSLLTSPRITRNEHRDDEIIVKFKGRDRFVRVANSRGEEIETLLAQYNNRPDVEYAEANYIAHALGVPNDSYYSYQWNFDNEISGSIHMEDAWDVSNGSGVIVAVIDTGVAYENYNGGGSRYYLAPDLADTTFVQGYDFVNNDFHPNDDEGHGTHVTGTVAQSTNNNLGLAGIAHGASIMPIKVLGSNGSGTYADIADAVIYAADNGAHVINLSLGGSSSSTYLKEALAYAYNKGVVIVAAAGNRGASSILYPAAVDEYVIAVGATRFDETRTSYSDYGSSLDIMAPGGDMDVDQNGDGYGDGILQQTFGYRTSNFGYYFYTGTSMAAPHVAGVAALLISNGNAVTPSDVREAIESTAKDLGAIGWDTFYGNGLLNAAAALAWSSGKAPIIEEPTPPEEPPIVPEDSNEPPTITSTPLTTTTESELYTYDVDAIDPDEGDTLTYSLTINPDGMTIDSVTGLIEWTPSNAQVGDNSVEVKVTDSGELSDSQAFNVNVSPVPETPPPPPPPVDPEEIVIFEDSFEGGLSNWTQDSQNDWARSNQRATDGNYSAEIDGSATGALLISPLLNLQGKTNATVSFDWYIERRFDRGEYIAFEISTDGGSNWAEFARLRGNRDQEDTWHSEEFILNNISNLQLRFKSTVSKRSEDGDVDLVKVLAF